MTVYVNGNFVPAEQAAVSVFDRGFLYGDGLFESVRVYDGMLVYWDAHAARLQRGAHALRIRIPVPLDQLRESACEILKRNLLANAILRISLSRGPGPRGYSIRGAETPTLVITAHPAPALDATPSTTWRLHTARVRLAARDPIGEFKTTSKLTHILARAEAEDAGADEALLLNTDGHIAESAAANLFWLGSDTAFTPALSSGCLAGVTRGIMLELLAAQGWKISEVLAGPEVLASALAVFTTVSSLGVVEISHLDGRPLPRHPALSTLRAAYQTAISMAVKSSRICG